MATQVYIPKGLKLGRELLALLNAIVSRITETAGIAWNQINFTGSSINSIADVQSTAPSADQVLRHDGVDKYVNVDAAATTSTRGFVKQAAAVADLNQTIAGPTIVEVQAISDKVDALLASLRTAGTLET